jgi:hypothetical protein
MQVYVGLWEDPWFEEADISQTYLGVAAEKSVGLIELMRNRGYAKYASFAGCYVSLEPFNFRYDSARIQALRGYFNRVSTACKSLRAGPPLKVAVAASFNPANLAHPDSTAWLASATETERVYRETLSGSGLDVLMIQDGVGTRTAPGQRWHGRLPEYMTEVEQYFAAFRRAAESTRPQIAFWSDVELFEGGAAGSPASWDRIAQQLRAEAPHVGSGLFIGYDFYHFMNPCLGSTIVEGEPLARGRASERLALYRAYARHVSAKDSLCGAE